jgi:hypothetical protein
MTNIEHWLKHPCPACGSTGTLFIGNGGYLTCSLIGCPDPCKAGDVLDNARGAVDDLRAALNELGVPGPGYPAPVANAVEHINAALARLGGQ